MDDARYVTVVFEVNDSQRFERELGHLFQLLEDAESSSYRTVAWSADHEIRRCELYEESAEQADDLYELREVMERIAGHADIGGVQSLEELCEGFQHT